jgi:uncharacterized protein YggE
MQTPIPRLLTLRVVERPALVLLVTLGLTLSPLLLATSCLAEPPAGVSGTEAGTRARARGQATVVAPPDLSIVQLAVVSEAPKAAAAAQANAKQTRAVLAALGEAFGEAAEIESSGYTLSPRYDFQKDRGRVLRGFTARSALRVKSRDVEAAGRIIDVAVAAGADEINAVRFGLADDTPQREQALAEATREARRRAEVMAEAIGLRVLRVVAVDEGGHGVVPLRPQARALAMEARSADTPIEVAGVEVRADVSIEVEVGP